MKFKGWALPSLSLSLRKPIVFVVMALLIFGTFFSTIAIPQIKKAHASSPWYDAGWSYRKPITVDNSGGGALTNYQVKITLNNTNFDFSKAKLFGEDLRFTDDDKVTPINWWRESYNSSTSTASIWVKIPNIPAYSTKDIYLYYGNSTAVLPSTDATTQYNVPHLANAANSQTTPTYDGSGQAVHPDIVYASQGWNGWKYWLLMEPTPATDNRYEDPSILVSNDGVSWEVPVGLTNPIVPRVYPSGFNSDGDMVLVDNTLYAYYRYNSFTGNTTILRRTSSTDGIHWTTPQDIFTISPSSTFASQSIVYENNSYTMFSVDTVTRDIYYRTSNDGLSWSDASLSLSFPNAWHIDVEKYEGHYIMLLTDNEKLYYLYSDDKTSWTSLGVVLSPSVAGWDQNTIYRSTFIVDGAKFRVWYSAYGAGNVVHTGYAEDNNWSYSSDRDTSGFNVFDVFDDFEDGALNSNRWTQVQTGGGVTQVASTPYAGKYALQTNGSGGVKNVLSSSYQDAGNAVFEAYIKSGNFFNILSSSSANTGYAVRSYEIGTARQNQIYKVVNGTYTSLFNQSVPGDTPNIYRHWKVIRYGNNIKFYIDDVLLGEANDSNINTGGVGLAALDAIMYTDQVIVRKYASPEPSINSVGSESVLPSNPILQSTACPSESAWCNNATPDITVTNADPTNHFYYTVDQVLSPDKTVVEAGTFDADGSFTIPALASESTWHVHVIAQNSDDDFSSNFSTYKIQYDATAPTVSDGMPSGTLSAGITLANLAVATSEAATCRYSATAGTAYGSMTNTFSTTGGTSHSTTASGLSSGNSYSYYVRCQDTAGNSSTSEYSINFKVASLPPVQAAPVLSPSSSSNTSTVDVPVSQSTSEATPQTAESKEPSTTESIISKLERFFKTKVLQLNGQKVVETVKFQIVDKDGKPIPNLEVTIHPNPQTDKTDENGVVTFSNVPVGKHTLAFATQGESFKKKVSVADPNINQGTFQAEILIVKAEQDAIPIWVWILISVLSVVALAFAVLYARRKK